MFISVRILQHASTKISLVKEARLSMNNIHNGRVDSLYCIY